MKQIELIATTEDLAESVPTLLIFGWAVDAGPRIVAFADEVTMETDVNTTETLKD